MMAKKKIEDLTDAQRAQIPAYVKRWTEVGLSTAPADRPAAEAAIAAAYRAAGLASPKIVWCGSPLSQGLTRALVLDRKFAEKVGRLLSASVRASVRDSVRDSVGDSVRDSVWDSVWDSVGASVWDSVGASVGDSVWDSVWASVWDSVRDSVWDSVRDSVWDSVWDSVGDSVWDSVWASVRDSVWDSVGASGYGQHDAFWIGFYAFFREQCGLTEETEKIQGLTSLTKSAGWFLPHEKICWVSERHNILRRDERGRLHSIAGPAVAYPDGWAIYAVHGVRVPADIIEKKESITSDRIDNESNAEVRRVMIELMGYERYIFESGAKLIHSDETGALYKKEFTDDEPLVMVHVVNSTPEPDGTIKKYLLRVPPQMERARQAVAWTFDIPEMEYRPLVET
jgi:hypothetical protein